MIRFSLLVCLALARMLNASPQHSLIQQSIDNKTYAADLQAGAVVEKITKNAEGDKAGLQEGDILLAWSRGDSKGEIQSPFDLTAIEIEQAPLGSVKIEGRRGGETMAWSLGIIPWQIAARPNFSSDLLSSYREAQELADAAKAAGPEQATERWKLLAGRFSASQSPWIAAWLFFHDAELLRSARQWKEADDAYQAALEHAAGAGPLVEAQLLQSWATAYQQRNDWGNAEKYFQQAIAKGHALRNDSLAIASSLDAIGNIWSQRGDFDKAEQYSSQALEMREKLAPESLPVASSLQSLGDVAHDRGDTAKAEEYYQKAFAIRNRLAPESLALASGYTSLGIVARLRGDLAKADQYEHHALDIRKKLAPESFLVAASLNNLGLIAEERGDLSKAEQYLRQALDLKQKLVPGSLSVVNGLINLGNVEGSRGDLDQAEQYYRRALEIQQKLAPRNQNVAAILGNLGKLEQYRGNLEKAEQYYRQSLEIFQERSPGSDRVAAALTDLGEVAEQRGDLATAAQYYHQSIAIKEKHAPESLSAAETIQGLGNVARLFGDSANAEKYYRQALAIREKVAPGSTVHAESLAAVASILRDQGQPDSAAQFYGQAIDALESQTARLGGSEEVRSGFGAKHSGIYTAYVDLLLAQKKPERAFEVLERSRARVLLEMLAAAHVDIRKGADPSLLEQERSLQASLTSKYDRRLRLLEQKSRETQLAAIAKDIEDLEKQYQDVEERLRVSSPGYAALTQPQPLTFSGIRQLLDSDTLLLEYSLGEQQSHVFAVTSESVSVYDLPKREEIENLAKRLDTSLTARNQSPRSESGPSRQARLSRADSDYLDVASALSRVLLRPAKAQLGHKRWLIVADAALLHVPFAALPEAKSTPTRTQAPVIARHEVVCLPSASVLATLRRERPARIPRLKEAMILADPVFDREDERVSGKRLDKPQPAEQNNAQPAESSDSLTRSARDVDLFREGRLYLPRLPFSRREAEAISAVIPAGRIRMALDFDASRKLAVSSELAKYRIVHFATHALVNDKHPALSGLVLSLVDERGQPQQGFLDLQDIYNMNLAADLVVLSACDTALGKQIDGEGMIGLTRGFMYSGARGVIGTLWKVEDSATAKFMKHFYVAMEQNHMSPAQALRHAQLALWEEKDWAAPYYWAAFTLQGDWR